MVCIYYVINGACKQSFFKLILKGVRSSPHLIIFNISEKKIYSTSCNIFVLLQKF